MPSGARSREHVTKVEKLATGRRRRKGDVEVGHGLDSLPQVMKGSTVGDKKPLALVVTGGKMISPEKVSLSFSEPVRKRRKSGKALAAEKAVVASETPPSQDVSNQAPSASEAFKVRNMLNDVDGESSRRQRTGPLPPADGSKVVLDFGVCLNPECLGIKVVDGERVVPILRSCYALHAGGGTCCKACDDKYLKNVKKSYL